MKRLRRLFVLMLLIYVIGCFEDAEPETARLRIDGSGEVQLVTSTHFELEDTDFDGEPEVNFITVDSMQVSLPFEQQYSVRERGLFFARAAHLNTPASGGRMRVFIDEEARYDQMFTASDSVLQFIYNAITIN